MIIALFDIALFLLNILSVVVIVQVVVSWLVAFNVINLHQPFVRAVFTAMDRLTEPLYRPIRRIMPDFGGIDFSPIVLLLAIRIVMMLIDGLRFDVARAML